MTLGKAATLGKGNSCKELNSEVLASNISGHSRRTMCLSPEGGVQVASSQHP